ncbi:hypothetical protein RIR_jg785.t1 [Rhizophagus irregularis DAOM 181602=DAOM 197198]|nr:hypothetical protein RIR_jg785.t1 [Rhizophagus irregularis DAOM 181602=DAOM 197198]
MFWLLFLKYFKLHVHGINGFLFTQLGWNYETFSQSKKGWLTGLWMKLITQGCWRGTLHYYYNFEKWRDFLLLKGLGLGTAFCSPCATFYFAYRTRCSFLLYLTYNFSLSYRYSFSKLTVHLLRG